MINEIITVEDIFNEMSKATKLYTKEQVSTGRKVKTVVDEVETETDEMTTKYGLTDAGCLLLNILDTVNGFNFYDRFECETEFIEGQGNTMDKYEAIAPLHKLVMPAAVLMDSTLAKDRRAMDYLIRRVGAHVTLKLGSQEFTGKRLRPDEFIEAQRDFLHYINRKVVQAIVTKVSRPIINLDKATVRTVVTRKSDNLYVIEDTPVSEMERLYVIKNPGWYEDRAYTQVDDGLIKDILVNLVKGFKDEATRKEAITAGSSKSENSEVRGNDGTQS